MEVSRQKYVIFQKCIQNTVLSKSLSRLTLLLKGVACIIYDNLMLGPRKVGLISPYFLLKYFLIQQGFSDIQKKRYVTVALESLMDKQPFTNCSRQKCLLEFQDITVVLTHRHTDTQSGFTQYQIKRSHLLENIDQT